MRLNEYEHELQRDLQSVASDLRWSAVDLKRIAEQLRKSGNEADAQTVLRSCEILQSDEERLQIYAMEVKARTISRIKVHCDVVQTASPGTHPGLFRYNASTDILPLHLPGTLPVTGKRCRIGHRLFPAGE